MRTPTGSCENEEIRLPSPFSNGLLEATKQRTMTKSMERDGQADAIKKFTTERSELIIRIDFANQFWALIPDIPKLYTALLDGFREFGVTANEIRSDNGDGSIGGYNVHFWSHGFKASSRIRLESAEFHIPNLVGADVETFAGGFLVLANALIAAKPDLKFRGYAVTASFHGRVTGLDGRSYLSRFVKDIPQIGSQSVGNGGIFHYLGNPPTASVSLMLDLSAAISNGVWIRHSSEITAVAPQDVRTVIETQLNETLTSLGLA